MIIDTGRFQAQRRERQADAGVVDDLVASLGVGPIVARVLASRCGTGAGRLMAPGLMALDQPGDLPDMDVARKRLAKAIVDGEVIGVVTDHDVDGVTSHAVLVSALTRFGVPRNRIHSFIGHRLKDGYGLSDHVADRILADPERPAVIITADCGSSDEPRIARLAAKGIQTIVTDHHEMGYAPDADGNMVETPPPSALAVINPSRADSVYPDAMICGCFVTWLTMCCVRQDLMKATGDDIASLVDLIDYVALGTVADCVSLGTSINNRAILQAGLPRIAARVRPCWRASALFVSDFDRLGAQDLAFGIGPRINARGRLDEAMAGVHFLLSTTDEEAERWAATLDEVNTERKAIERELTEVAMLEAEMAVSEGHKGLAIWLEAGHPGVHGIVASRILERFAHPVVCLSPHAVDPELATGSARSPEGVHIRDVLEGISRKYPDLLLGFGGHAAAAGLTLKKKDVERFIAVFAEATKDLDPARLTPAIDTDGVVDPAAITYGLLDRLHALEPYGQKFPPPLFEADFLVTQVRVVGQDKSHVQLTLVHARTVFKAIWFFAVDEHGQPLCQLGEKYHFVFTPGFNTWKDKTTIQLMVKGVVR